MANKPNAITDITLKTLQNLKVVAPPLFTDFVKAAERYQKAAQGMSALGVALADTIYKIGGSTGSDLGDGIKKLAEFIKDVETRREELARAILSDLIVPMKSSIENEQKEAVNFERYYKRDKEAMRTEILRLEGRTKKAGKKTTPEVLKQQISELNDKIKEAETMRSNKLRDIILLERKRYATFLSMWNAVLAKDHDAHADALSKIKANESLWIGLSTNYNTLPKDIDDMISRQERTLVQIQPAGEDAAGNYRLSYAPGALNQQAYAGGGGGGSNYDSYDSYASYDSSSYDSSFDYGSAAPAAAAGGANGARARALYDYASDEPSDLPLRANDIVVIVQDDDGSGWTKGQDTSGRVGIFPTSYIEYI